ncbi:VWA domain-containing protein [Prescottella subtropica]|uniref:VWA domain-containing protein n=1 Tax=Prescottella subtropica TaxID=2545757 RepID=UPI001F4F43BF|nr:VWA domain-containing protein [Prescottella subtropica]
MGRHRNDRRLRGVSKGPLAAAGAVLLLVLGVLGWFQLRDRTDEQGTAAAGLCVEGAATLTVAADPALAPPIRELAARFTGTRPVVRDHCITVAVHDAATDAAVAALTDGTWTDTLGPAPALWIPTSTAATDRVPAGVLDGGPKPVAGRPAAILDTTWVDDTAARAAAAFVDYLRKPEQQQTLTAAGFDTVDPPAPAPAPAGRTTTILLDVSGSMGADDLTGTRLNNTAAALTTRIDTLPDDTNLGLWVYSRGLDATKPYRIEVPTGPLADDDRRTRLATELRGLRPRTATSTYTSLTAAHTAAVDGYTDGRTNSVLLITDGPDDSGTGTAGLEQALATAAHPVRIDVIFLGDDRNDPDRATLEQVTDRTGGTLVTVPDAHGPELAAALTTMLGQP